MLLYSGGQDPPTVTNARRTGSLRYDNGCSSDFCVEQAAKGLIKCGFTVEVAAECVRGFNEQIAEVVEKRLPMLKIV